MGLPKAAKAKKGDDDQYFCVGGAGEKDWLSDIPATSSAPLESVGVTELCTANMGKVLESDARLHAMTGYGRREFGMLYRAFAAGWGAAEAGEIERRRRHERGREGKGGGARPAADAYEDQVKNVPPMRDGPTRASEPGHGCALRPLHRIEYRHPDLRLL